MSYNSKLGDKTLKLSSKYKQYKSENHTMLERRIIRRYLILNPDSDRMYDIVRKYVNIYNKKYDGSDVYCLFKMITKTNNIKYIRLPPRPHIHYLYCILTKSVLKRINKERDNISRILEMRITFVSQSKYVTSKQYLKQRKTMFEIILNRLLNRNPSLIKLLDRSLPHPMIKRYITDEEYMFA